MAEPKPSGVICEGDVCRRVTPEEAAAHAAANAGKLSALSELLGDTLLGKDGVSVPLSQVTGKGKVLGLYFSAHWCPPCRGFTPVLAKIYTKFKELHAQKDNFEIVFVSSDRNEEAFKEYFAEMPWLALPFDRRELKAALGKRFKVRGIPTFVILDGENGEVITANGREVVSEDEECENFPWRPKPLDQVLAGPLVDKSGKEVEATEALAGKVTLVYFSAHWCPPCKRFTPQLAATYEKLKAAGKAVEVVFVSGDRSEAEFKEYLGEMPWLAVPHADKKRIGALNTAFEVEGIPTLIVLDEDFKVITPQGRGAVSADPEGSKFPWRPQPVEVLSEHSVSAINDMPVFLLALPGSDEAAAEARANELLLPAATSAAGAGVRFLWGLHSNDLTGRVLDFVHEAAEEHDPKPRAVLLNVPEQESYPLALVGDAITAEAVSTAIDNFKAGALRAKPLGDDE